MRKCNTLIFSIVPEPDSRETRTRSEYRSKNSPRKIFLYFCAMKSAKRSCFQSLIFFYKSWSIAQPQTGFKKIWGHLLNRLKPKNLLWKFYQDWSMWGKFRFFYIFLPYLFCVKFLREDRQLILAPFKSLDNFQFLRKFWSCKRSVYWRKVRRKL